MRALTPQALPTRQRAHCGFNLHSKWRAPVWVSGPGLEPETRESRYLKIYGVKGQETTVMEANTARETQIEDGNRGKPSMADSGVATYRESEDEAGAGK